MNDRLLELIQYKTGGKQADFAEFMGWSPQYLNRLTKGESGIGIRPIITLLEKFPELNARWASSWRRGNDNIWCRRSKKTFIPAFGD